MTKDKRYPAPDRGSFLAGNPETAIQESFRRLEDDVVIFRPEAELTEWPAPVGGPPFIASDSGKVFKPDGSGWVELGSFESARTDEEIEDVVDALLTAGSNVSLAYDDAAGTLEIDASDSIRSEESVRDLAGAMAANGLAHDDANDTLGLDVVASGQVTLSSGSATVDTGVSATDATFQLAIGVDDPGADTKLAGRLFWDDSAGSYHVEIVEQETSVGNPTANYDVIRVR